jgi:hypothetical protein
MSVGVNGTGRPDPEQNNKIPEIDIGVTSAPVQSSGRTLGTREIDIEVATIQWDRVGVFSEKNGYSVRYRATKDQGGDFLDLNLPGRWIKIPAAEVIKVATDMQNKLRQAPEDVEDIDHQTLLDDLLKHHNDDDGTIQVLEGSVDDVKLDHFSGNTAASILEMIHFIKVNNLQEQKPWCVVWNLYHCMIAAAGRA